MSSRLPLSRQVFVILTALIEERCGLCHRVEDLERLADKLSPRARERGFDSLLEYYYFLRYDAEAEAEFDALTDALVVGETYFFRESAALAALIELCVPQALAEGRTPRLWCAACSTGEEPLTLAMLLEEKNLLDRVELVASDISPRALKQAESGLYKARSLRAIPPHALGRWLEPAGDGVRVAEHLRRAVTWQRVNLVCPSEVASLGEFDAILCRNVMIYFSEETVTAVATTLSRALRSNGLLLVGASESLLRLDVPFSCEEQRGVFFYRKMER